MEWINVIIQGILTGALYALFAAGLSLVFGVMRLVNLAHGDLIVVAAFLGLACLQKMGLHPLASIVVVLPVMMALGYGLQRGLLNKTLGKGLLPPLMVTFGLSIIVQNGLMEMFSANTQRLPLGDLDVAKFDLLPGVSIGWYPLLILVVAVAVIGGVQALMYRTRLGAALRATADDTEATTLMGLNSTHLFAVATAIAMGITAIAGLLMAAKTNFDPASGASRLIYAYEAVIVGGMGSLWGTLAGGLVIGVAQAVGGALDPRWQILAGHLAFLSILMVAPNGLMSKKGR